MKRTYIAPQTDITTLGLKDSVLTDPGFNGQSPYTDEGGSNAIQFDDADIETTDNITSHSLWDE